MKKSYLLVLVLYGLATMLMIGIAVAQQQPTPQQVQVRITQIQTEIQVYNKQLNDLMNDIVEAKVQLRDMQVYLDKLTEAQNAGAKPLSEAKKADKPVQQGGQP